MDNNFLFYILLTLYKVLNKNTNINFKILLTTNNILLVFEVKKVLHVKVLLKTYNL